MDDWKLGVTPVVRLERPNKTFVLPFRTAKAVEMHGRLPVTFRYLP